MHLLPPSMPRYQNAPSNKNGLFVRNSVSIAVPYAGAFLVVPGERSLLIPRSDVTTRRRVMSRVVCLRPLRHLSPRWSQAKAAPDRDERSVRAAHAARPDLAPIQRVGWCLPPAAQCVIRQSGQTSSGPDVLGPAERSAFCLLPPISRVSILRRLLGKMKPEVLERLFSRPYPLPASLSPYHSSHYFHLPPT